MNLVYTAKALTGWEGQGVCQHISYFGDKIAFMSNGKISNVQRVIRGQANVVCDNVVHGTSYQYKKLLDSSSFKEIYDSLEVDNLENFDDYCIIGGIHYPNSNLTRSGNRVGKFPNDSGQIKFQSTGLRVTDILAIVKASNIFGKHIHHVSFDPDEFSPDLFCDIAPKNITVYHGYDIPRYNIKRLDTLQKFLLNRTRNSLFFTKEKPLDFVFGYTVDKFSNREKYPEYINNLSKSFNKKRVLCRNYLTEENSLVPKDVYTELIKESKYTFIIPSYDNTCFSIYRFIESLAENCLPLIHPDCNITEVSESFGFDLSILVKTTPFSNDEYHDILQSLKDKFLFSK